MPFTKGGFIHHPILQLKSYRGNFLKDVLPREFLPLRQLLPLFWQKGLLEQHFYPIELSRLMEGIKSCRAVEVVPLDGRMDFLKAKTRMMSHLQVLLPP